MTTELRGNKGRHYRAQVLDESFFGEQIPWTDKADVFVLSLHTGAPEDERGHLVNEVFYAGYQRVALPRNRLTWSRTGNLLQNRIEARFALCQQEGARIRATHWAITPSGHPSPAYQGKFEKPLLIEPGIRPVVDPKMIEVEEV